MKIYLQLFFNIVIISLSIIPVGLSQDMDNDDLSFEVNRIYPAISISKNTLDQALTLSDLNKFYKSSWVKKYLSVEIMTLREGLVVKSTSENDTLTKEQIANMQSNDVGQEISVVVHYLPKNSLKRNENKIMDFSFLVDPEHRANYVTGEKSLNEYLKTNAINKIPNDVFTGYDLAAVTFSIAADGSIVDAQLFQSSNNETVDLLLLETICNMPNWNPAQYANGTYVKQDFALTVGNMENCMVNTLNICKDN